MTDTSGAPQGQNSTRLTEGDQWGDDGHRQGGHEQVEAARQTGDLPDAGISQSEDVGVSVVHLDVAVDSDMS